MISASSAGIASQLSPQQVARNKYLTRGEKLRHLTEIREDLVRMQRNAASPTGDASSSLEAVDKAIEQVRTH